MFLTGILSVLTVAADVHTISQTWNSDRPGPHYVQFDAFNTTTGRLTDVELHIDITMGQEIAIYDVFNDPELDVHVVVDEWISLNGNNVYQLNSSFYETIYDGYGSFSVSNTINENYEDFSGYDFNKSEFIEFVAFYLNGSIGAFAATSDTYSEVLNRSYDFNLTLVYFYETCDCDLNNNGTIGVDDVSRFIQMYTSNDMNADVNNDGVLNFFDLATILENI